MRTISAADIDAALTFPKLIDALRAAFAADIVAPQRHHHAIARPGQTATFLLMPAWSGPASGRPYVATKLATVFPNNASIGRPSVYATVVLMDGETGEPLAAMDGTHLTLWRTAAASALAAGYLAREDASRMLMAGAGALAPFMIRAHASVRPLREVAIWNHNGARAKGLAEDMAKQAEAVGSTPIRITAADDLEKATRGADIVSCATMTREPLIKGGWLREGAHLDLVGAYNLDMREADDEALRRSRVFVDTKAALTEGGDVAVALRDGAIDPAHVRGDLPDLVSGQVRGRAADTNITLFKSIGTAIEDLAAAVAVWEGMRALR